VVALRACHFSEPPLRLLRGKFFQFYAIRACFFEKTCTLFYPPSPLRRHSERSEKYLPPRGFTAASQILDLTKKVVPLRLKLRKTFHKKQSIHMKKALTLSFLLLANIAVLAHSAIPHHYHNGVPVAVAGVYNADSEEACTYDCRRHHHEPNNATIEDCLLENVVARTVNDEQQLDASGSNVFLLLWTFYLPSGSVSVPEDLLSISFVQQPFVQSYHTTFVTRSLGLRAPPAC
jgi:hypothetical protein